MSDDVLTRIQVQRLLGRSRATVLTWIWEKKLPATLVEEAPQPYYVIRREDLDAFVPPRRGRKLGGKNRKKRRPCKRPRAAKRS